TNNIFFTIGYFLLRFFLRKNQRIFQLQTVVPIVNKGFPFCFVVFSMCVKLFSGIESVICISRFNQRICILSVKLFSFALAVWAAIRFFSRTFVVGNIQPIQRFNNVCLGTFHISILVSILYSK